MLTSKVALGLTVVFFLLAIVLSVLFRFTDSDYPFSIFKLFLTMDYDGGSPQNVPCSGPAIANFLARRLAFLSLNRRLSFTPNP